jgi:hypothetical protein
MCFFRTQLAKAENNAANLQNQLLWSAEGNSVGKCSFVKGKEQMFANLF